jgi:hypothetical protein
MLTSKVKCEYEAQGRSRSQVEAKSHAGERRYVDKMKKLSVISLFERLIKAVGRHIDAGEVLKADIAVLVLLFCIHEVIIDVLCTLIAAVLADHIKCGHVVSVASLSEQPSELCHLLSGVRESNLLSLSGRGRNKSLTIEFIRDNAAGHCDDITG